MSTIGNLNYKIGADTSGLTKGVVATKRELRDAGKIMTETRTPAERMGRQLDQLGNLYRKGAIDAETYRRRVRQIRMEKLGSTPIIGRFVRQFANMHPALIAAGVGLAAVTTAALVTRRVINQLTEAVKAQMTELDKLGKQARVIGSTAQELRELRFAAGQATQLDDGQMDSALQRMTRNIAEAAQGAGSAQDALRDLGLEARVLRDAGPGEAIRMIADALADIPDPADRARLAYRIFGQQGAQLAPLLGRGRDALDESAASFRALRGEISDLDVSRIEAANDAMDQAKLAIGGLVEVLTIELAPNIQAAADITVEWMTGTREAIVGVDEAAGRAGETVSELTIWIASAMSAAQQLKKFVEVGESTGTIWSLLSPTAGSVAVTRRIWDNLTGARNTMEELGDIMDEPDWGEQFIERVMEVRSAVQQTRDVLSEDMPDLDLDDEIADGIDALDEAIRRFTEGLQDQAYYADLTREELALLKFEWEGATEAQLAAARSAMTLIDAQKQTAEWQRQLDEQMKRGDQLTQSLRTPAERMADDLAEIQELFDAGAIDETTFVRALENLRGEVEEPIVAKIDVLGVESAELGTQAAARALARFRQQASEAAGEVNVNLGGRDVQADEAKDQREVLERIADLLAQIAGNTDEDPLQVREVTIT